MCTLHPPSPHTPTITAATYTPIITHSLTPIITHCRTPPHPLTPCRGEANAAKWQYHFTEADIAEIEAALKIVEARGIKIEVCVTVCV